MRDSEGRGCREAGLKGVGSRMSPGTHKSAEGPGILEMVPHRTEASSSTSFSTFPFRIAVLDPLQEHKKKTE